MRNVRSKDIRDVPLQDVPCANRFRPTEFGHFQEHKGTRSRGIQRKEDIVEMEVPFDGE
jgi:hypothetical protein